MNLIDLLTEALRRIPKPSNPITARHADATIATIAELEQAIAMAATNQISLLAWAPATTPPPFRPHDSIHDWEFTSVPVLAYLGEGRQLCMARYRQHMDLDTGLPDPDSPPRWTTNDSEEWDIETMVAWTYVTRPEPD